MKAVVAAFNQEKALVGAFSVITNLWMELFGALVENNFVNPDKNLGKVPKLIKLGSGLLHLQYRFTK